MTKYPIGIQTFEIIRNQNYAYADKTGTVYRLVASGARQVFLSRPRRFGKSLLVSTLKAYFEGRKELFEGLELSRLETEWESYPVLRFDLSGITAIEPSKFESDIIDMLRGYETTFDVAVNNQALTIGTRFAHLIKNIAQKTGKQVVVLVDEYDKGIVDVLQNKDILDKNIELLRPFYSQFKAQDEYLRFVFLTGVSRFRNLTLFSSPNHFLDITMNPDYAAICGITADELHTVFADGIETLAREENLPVDEVKYQLKLKYDSYRFSRNVLSVYNPFSILNCLYQRQLGNYWLASGSTKVFIDFLKNAEYNLEEIENQWVSEETLAGPFSEKEPIALLFQTGYLTITGYDSGLYRIAIPNGEVRSALVEQLVPLYLGINKNKVPALSLTLARLVNNGDAEGLMKEFQSIMALSTFQHFRFNDVEDIYNLTLWLICKMAGINARSELNVAGGVIDMVIETPKFVYVMEFKKDQCAQKALGQIESHGYALPWSADDRTIYKIGIEFSTKNRNISSWVIK